ncbi:MAG: SOS response-associated peptidase [Pirellulaceae bacterium]
MCGRFTLRTPLTQLIEQFEVSSQLQVALRFNIAPTQSIVAVRAPADGTGRELVLLKWGLIPSWADDPAIGNRMINARADGVATKPSFRSAFKKRRCLILADGYYEWQKVGAKKQPYLIHRQDDGPFAFAGLWERWRGGADGEAIESCTIITTDANPVTRPIHDRMPVILEPEDYDRWLSPDVQDREELESLLVPSLTQDLVADRVSTYVNNPRHEDEACVQPI